MCVLESSLKIRNLIYKFYHAIHSIDFKTFYGRRHDLVSNKMNISLLTPDHVLQYTGFDHSGSRRVECTGHLVLPVLRSLCCCENWFRSCIYDWRIVLNIGEMMLKEKF